MKNHQEEKKKLKHWHGIVCITSLLFLLLLFLQQEEGDRNTGKRGGKKEEEEKKKEKNFLGFWIFQKKLLIHRLVPAEVLGKPVNQILTHFLSLY